MALINSSRFGAIATLTRLTLPLLIGQLAIVGLGATDVLLSGRSGTEQLAGVTLGAALFDLPIMLLVGIFIANGALVSRRHGAGDRRGLRRQLHASLGLAVPLGALGGLMVTALRWFILPGLDAPEDARAVADAYLLPMTASAVLLPFVLAFRTGLEGIGRPGVAMTFNLLAFALNIPLDYALIYGHWGLPALGGEGCAWSTLTILSVLVLGQLFYLRRAAHLRPLRLLRGALGIQPKTVLATARMGAPIGCAILAEAGFFHVVPLIIATLGATAVAAHGVAMTLDLMMFMVPLSLSQAITLTLARSLGAGQADRARQVAFSGLTAGITLGLVQCGFFLIAGRTLPGLFSTDGDVVALAGSLLQWAALIRIFDALHICGTGILRGLGDTRSTLIISLAAFWGLGMPLCVWLAADSGAIGAWTAILAAVTAASAMTLFQVARKMSKLTAAT
ncbi:MAG: hypothetical protein CMK32_00750 [Porticoccaceae bacterium]|nr:hypothetical protein [Porticoccaceae bacterium]